MPELSLRDIALISREVTSHEIIFPHLADELIDHICCDVENEMRNGMSFHDAYNVVRGKIGHRRLKEIQEETLYAVDTKYRKMKNTMKISGIAGTVLLGFAALFKIMHWPYAGIMLVLGGLSMAFVFMPSALTVLWKETHSSRRLFLYISAFLAGMLFVTGVVFKIQHWPLAGLILAWAVLSGILLFLPALLAAKLQDQENRSKKAVYIIGAAGIFIYASGLLFKIQHWPLATILLTTGLVLIFLVAFPWYTHVTWKDEPNVSSRFIYMVVGAIAIMVPSILVSLNVQQNYEGGYFMLNGQQQALIDYQSGKNREVINSCTDTVVSPVLTSINSGTEKILAVIDGIEAEMKEGSGGNPFSTTPYNELLKSGTAPRNRMNDALGEYTASLSALMPDGTSANIEALLDPAVYFPEAGPETDRISLLAGLHMLKLMRNGILTSESYALAVVLKN